MDSRPTKFGRFGHLGIITAPHTRRLRAAFDEMGPTHTAISHVSQTVEASVIVRWKGIETLYILGLDFGLVNPFGLLNFNPV